MHIVYHSQRHLRNREPETRKICGRLFVYFFCFLGHFATTYILGIRCSYSAIVYPYSLPTHHLFVGCPLRILSSIHHCASSHLISFNIYAHHDDRRISRTYVQNTYDTIHPHIHPPSILHYYILSSPACTTIIAVAVVYVIFTLPRGLFACFHIPFLMPRFYLHTVCPHRNFTHHPYMRNHDILFIFCLAFFK